MPAKLTTLLALSLSATASAQAPPPNPSPPPPFVSPAPATPPMPPVPAGHMWQIVSGSSYCQVETNGLCVTDGVGDHGSYEACSFRATQDLYATSTFFMTEARWDYITIGSTRYSGADGPTNVFMNAGDDAQWYADSSINYGGFVICATNEVTSVPPMLPPPPPPSPSPPPPTYTPAPPLAAGQMFIILSSDGTPNEYCNHTTNSDGLSCVTDGIGDHDNNEACIVQATQDLFLNADYFQTENYWDYIQLQINGTNGPRYSGTNGPANEMMAAGDTFSWSTDSSITRGGFVLCGSTTPFSLPPMLPPPPAAESVAAAAGADAAATAL